MQLREADHVEKIAAADAGTKRDASPFASRTLEWLLPAATVISLLSACLRHPGKKLVWYDELFSWTLVTDPSLHHAFSALRQGVDAGLPLYYVLARAWLAVFGSSALALRLFSSVCVALALLLVWAALRRCYSLRATAFGVLTVWCASQWIFLYNFQARFYGLFLLAMAAVVLVFARSFRESLAANGRGPSAALFLATFATHAALVNSHPFGILYSGVVVVALIGADAAQRRLRPMLYAAGALAWITLLPWRESLARTAAVGVPHTWIEPPTLRTLAWTYMFGLYPVAVPIVIAAAALGFAERLRGLRQDSFRDDEHRQQRQAMMILAGALLAMPLVLTAVSAVSKPVLLDRYLLPAVIGVAIILAQLASAVPARAPRLEMAWLGLLVVLVCVPQALMTVVPRPRDPNQAIEAIVPANVPVIAEDPHDFLPLVYNTERPSRPYYFLLDWNSAVEETAPRRAAPDTILLRRWKEAGYLSERIVTPREFLCGTPEFVVFHNRDFRWYQRTIAANPGYVTRRLGSGPGAEHANDIIFVQRNADADCGRGE